MTDGKTLAFDAEQFYLRLTSGEFDGSLDDAIKPLTDAQLEEVAEVIARHERDYKVDARA